MSEAPDIDKATRIRRLWPNEARDFTPWLSKNLHLLGDPLRLKLKCVNVEQPVGPYSLDILAETDAGSKVAIENQLDWTDFQHLAQTLIYSSGLNVKVAIWVAPEFRYESARALHWLNCWTHDGLDFYGVKFEVGVTRDDTEFIAVVSPGGWNKDITLRPMEIPPETQQYHEFFRPLIVDLQRTGFAEKANQYYDYKGRYVPSDIDKDVWYAVSFSENSAWISLHIRTDDKQDTRIFDRLKADKDDIKASIYVGLNTKWEWRRHAPYAFCTVNLRRDASIDDPPDKLEETRAWMLDLLPKLKQVFDPRLAEILKELPE